MQDHSPTRRAACHFPVEGRLPAPNRAGADRATGAPVLSVRNLRRAFGVPGKGFFGAKRSLTAVADVSFELHRGETLAVVGESGCGKSTIARMVMGIHRPSAGEMVIAGTAATALPEPGWHALRERIQMVFQDPLGALDPRMTVGRQITEPLRLYRRGSAKDHRARLSAMLDRLGLAPALAERFPHQLSGGQRQRVVLARALILDPEILICDEPIAALDVSIQAQVVNLLARLQAETGLAILFISHDLRIVRHIAHRVAVMYAGRIVETGPAAEIFAAPRHPYTRALLSAIPTLDADGPARIRLAGEPPNPAAPPPGCPFHPRCTAAIPHCAAALPQLQGTVARVACHLAETP